MKPIFIKEIGFIANIGSNSDSAWKQVVERKANFDRSSEHPVARVSSKDFETFLPNFKAYSKLDKNTQLALFAVDQLKEVEKGEKTLVALGTSRGATTTWETAYQNFLDTGNSSVLDSPTTTAGQLASNAGMYLQLKESADMDQSITCSSGLRAIADACAWLNAGFVTQAIAGGAEAPLTDFTFSQMKALRILGGNGEWPCKSLYPNLRENTMVLGEGAAAFRLSSIGTSRDVRIVGVGFGSETGMSATGLTPHGLCLQKSMSMACEAANWNQPDAIIAHAPGTLKGDASELQAISSLFGKEIPTTSSKFLTGHCFGASGPISVWMACQMLKNNHWITPPWIENKEPKKLNRIIVNAVGFGANAVSLAIEYNAEP